MAAPAEARAVASALGLPASTAEVEWTAHRTGSAIDLVVTGVGKANAAGGVARVFDAVAPAAVVSVGIGGALPGSDLDLLDVVLGTRSVFADEGMVDAGGFTPISQMGFPPFGRRTDGDAAWDGMGFDGVEAIRALVRPHIAREGVIATVSTCSASDDGAREIVQRTGAIVEGMEGAAVGLACARLGCAFSELRVVSNTTGERGRQRWDLPGALQRIESLIARLREDWERG
ncbi:MAG: futalosine hydrolase [Planctomycetota bacterium]|nr:futalosine hydrolase [Planctomycetota bacterium]